MMHKLAAVEDARVVMTEGMDWSAWRWLIEKRRVREIADRATAALDRADKKVKAAWPQELRAAYAELIREDKHPSRINVCTDVGHAVITDPEMKLLAKRIKEADDKAERCRLAAEAAFDKAEQRFSAGMAREGAHKALHTYDLREAAIRQAEAASNNNSQVRDAYSAAETGHRRS
jgi:hypothetical protein